MKIKRLLLTLMSLLYLESGRILESYDLKYETYGELNEAKDNAIVVFHALTEAIMRQVVMREIPR